MNRKGLTLLHIWFAIALIAVAVTATARDRTPFNSLDEESTSLVIHRESNGFSLHWFPAEGLNYWAVTFSAVQTMTNLDTLAITSDTFYFHSDAEGVFSKGFFRVDPIDIVPPQDTTDLILAFNPVPLMFPVPGEDIDFAGFSINDNDAYDENGWSLHMFGNTWKYVPIQPRHVDSTDVWSIAAKLLELGEIHAFGVADSANYMHYVLWGKEAPQSENWLTAYEGFFAENEWVDIQLPVGEDWQGRFGYAPNIIRIYFINDNDTVATDGEVLFDEVRDITDALPLLPVAEFQWSILSRPHPDSILVGFRSFSYDLDSPLLSHSWNFGDGATSTLFHPQHTYKSQSRFPVTLSVMDSDNRTTWTTQSVVDSPITAQRQAWFAFTGDVILGRGYENNNGIIDTWGVDTIFAPTRRWLHDADLASVNLECPFTTATVRHPTKGIVFKADPDNVSGLVNAGIDFATLANNHVYDYLEPGMLETMAVLDNVGIVQNGSGMNDELARQLKFVSSNGISFGMLSFSDRTGSYNNFQPFLDAGRSRPGFAMWNRAAIDATVDEACAVSDFVVINTHSGDEYTLEPSLSLGQDLEDMQDDNPIFEVLPDTTQRQMRQYAIDKGAELVVAHHPHIIQGFEVYNGKVIAHSLGNFVFDLTYAETMPTVVLQAHFDGESGVDAAIVQPAYLNRWIPQPARGELARNILDYETRRSRDMDTWLIRSPGADSAFIVLDTLSAIRIGHDTTVSLPLTLQGSWWTTSPHKLPLDGYIVNANVTNAAGCQIRVGREKLLFGNMEDEGADDWQLNSGDEDYATDFAHNGARSIRLRRVAGNPSNIVTNNTFRFQIQSNQAYSICGWIKTENAVNATYQIQYYSQRSGGTIISQQEISAPISGTNDWLFVNETLLPPENATYVVIRMSLSSPATGTALAWFDDLSWIEWEDWRALPANFTFPYDYHYVQVRNSNNVGPVIVNYRREWVEPDGVLQALQVHR